MNDPGSGPKGKNVRDKESAARPQSRSRLVVRRVRRADIDALADLSKRVYAPIQGYSRRVLRAQLNNFPDGQFVAEYDGKVVGHCATFIISEKIALAPHSWAEITSHAIARCGEMGSCCNRSPFFFIKYLVV